MKRKGSKIAENIDYYYNKNKKNYEKFKEICEKKLCRRCQYKNVCEDK